MSKYPFIHLRTQSSYSLAESTIKINKLVDLAKQHNMPAIALTDNNNMFGALEFSIDSLLRKCNNNVFLQSALSRFLDFIVSDTNGFF